MKLKDLVKVPTATKKYDISKLDKQIMFLKHKKSKEQIANQLNNAKSKYLVVLGKQLNSDLCTLWAKNKNYHNHLEIADGYVESVVKNNDPVYNFIFSPNELTQLYNSITDRKLTQVAKAATVTLKEFLLRLYDDEKGSLKP